ncbi:AAA family ATPase [uncultured Clostridium sp.]|uniref:ParA family protein n=1 Tax=uncultured Clostridium sp. TaxID=59620 RepID=UPI0026036797|nr:AAA family ATPase [uncultured Clostridium sp.]
MKVISIFNQKGGVGKTTFSLNLATYISIKKNRKVLFIDNDGQANSTYILSDGQNDDYFSSNRIPTIEELYLSKKDINSFIVKSKFKNIDYIASSIDHVYTDLNLKNNRTDIMKSKLNNLTEDYDFIIIDNPPAMSNTVLNCLNISDMILAPIETCVFSMRGLINLINLTVDLNKDHTTKFFCFLSKVDNRKITKNIEVKEILESNLGASFINKLQVSSLSAYPNTIDKFETVITSKINNRAFDEIKYLSEYIIGRV